MVEPEKGDTVFKRLKDESLSRWLEDYYSLGGLWQKSVYSYAQIYKFEVLLFSVRDAFEATKYY